MQGTFIMIRKTILGFAAAAALVTTALAPTAASAGYYGHGYGYKSYYKPYYGHSYRHSYSYGHSYNYGYKSYGYGSYGY
jgi:hypothetical protein